MTEYFVYPHFQVHLILVCHFLLPVLSIPYSPLPVFLGRVFCSLPSSSVSHSCLSYFSHQFCSSLILRRLLAIAGYFILPHLQKHLIRGYRVSLPSLIHLLLSISRLPRLAPASHQQPAFLPSARSGERWPGSFPSKCRSLFRRGDVSRHATDGRRSLAHAAHAALAALAALARGELAAPVPLPERGNESGEGYQPESRLGGGGGGARGGKVVFIFLCGKTPAQEFLRLGVT
ncbi:hypothetical protein R5R35_013102 [Gryllus longicercus]|uniref:Uncharacterized protein n=1 Tax=Gryllus longicercus TaxID=2509291 RepID=A0AAN9V076_9ORTH